MTDTWFGLQPPADACHAWGARAIISAGVSTEPVLYVRGPKKGRQKYHAVKGRLRPMTRSVHWSHLDLLPDRQGVRGEPRSVGLADWIDRVLLPDIRRRIDAGERAFTSMGSVMTEWHDGCFHARACPNGSGGYLYLCAWFEPE
jgi:hypothetical protein